jgi:hypothetical protein
MQAFFLRNFNITLILSLSLAMGLAFYAGFLEGKRGVKSEVVLACSEDVLKELEIPLQQIIQEKPASIEKSDLTASATTQPTEGKYVGSKNGTKYYKPSCATAKRIKAENKVWFEDEEDATLQGYTPGKC